MKYSLPVRVPVFVAAVIVVLLAVATAATRGGLIVETVEEGSALHAAGLRAGDRLSAWEHVGQEGAPGSLASLFDWMRLVSEEAPRGAIRLTVDRDGARTSLLVAWGRWQADVRPELPERLLAGYEEALRLAADGRKEAAAGRIEALGQAAEGGALRSWLLWRAGETWEQADRLEPACRAYQAALEAATDAAARIAALDGLGSCHETASEFDRAEESFRESLRVRREAWGNGLGAARTLVDLGRLAENRDQLERGSEHLQEALRIQRSLAPDSLAEAGTLNEMAILAARRGDVDGAEQGFRATLAIQERLAPEALATANTVNNLGIMAYQRGHWEQADEHYRRALAVQERLAPDSLVVAGSLTNLGLVARERGDFDQAADYLRRALAIEERRAPGGLEVAESLHNLGNVARDRGRLDEAESRYREALRLEERLAPGGRSVASTVHNLGEVALDRGRLEQAEACFRRALAMWETLAPGGLDAASNFSNLADTRLRRGDPQGARPLYEAALGIQERLAPGSGALALTRNGLGKVARQEGRLEEAAQLFESALQALEEQAGRAGGASEGRAMFRARHARLYRDALELLLRLKRPQEAFAVLERSRARTLLDMMAERGLDFGDVPESLREARRRLSARYDEVQQQMAGLDPEKDRGAMEAALAELPRLREEGERLTDTLRRQSPRLAQLQYPRPLDLDGVRRALDPGTVLLAYAVGERRTDLFVVDAAGTLRVATSAAGEAALRREVDLFRSLIRERRRPGDRRSAALEAAGRRLFRLLVAPAAQDVARSERVLVLPDGPLHALPFAALVCQGSCGSSRYLVEWRPVHVAPSATVYAELRRQPREAAREGPTLVAFGDPVYPGPPAAVAVEDLDDPPLRSLYRRGFAFDPLPASRGEVEAIGRLYPAGARLYLGHDATEEQAKAVGPGPRYVHFATHGVLDERFPLNSALALTIPDAPASGHDNGLLQAWEILQSVRLEADLVVLSACESGLGKELPGEGLIGLTRAFHYAGARSVLASLWKVADQTTADLMVTFYAKLRDGMSKDEALRAAQLASLRGRAGRQHGAASPYYWAAFQLSGDWR